MVLRFGFTCLIGLERAMCCIHEAIWPQCPTGSIIERSAKHKVEVQ